MPEKKTPKPPSLTDKLGALASHGGKDKNVIKFSEPVLHWNLRFGKNEVVEFECPEAAGYFDTAFNGTEFSDEEPTRFVSLEELNTDPEAEGGTIDPDTIIGNEREGVKPGTTVAGVLLGMEPGTDGTLQVKSVNATVKQTSPGEE